MQLGLRRKLDQLRIMLHSNAIQIRRPETNLGEDFVRTKSILHLSASAVILAGIASFAAPALAQSTEAAAKEADGTLEEIVVTATKNETNLQDTPVSVQTADGDDLTATSVAELRDALNEVPGIVLASQGNFGLRVSARGSSSGILNGQSGVSTLYDGVFSSSPMLWRVGFYDVNRIETLLGPQGTLYGRNAQGGVVNLVTNNPTRDFGGYLTAGVGNYDVVNIQGAINAPLGEQFAVRVAGSYNDRGGYLSNGQNDNGTWGIRGKLLFEPTDGLSMLLGAEHYVIDEAGQAPVVQFTTPTRAVFAVPVTNTGTVQYSNQNFYKKRADRVWLETNADLGFARLTVIPAYFVTKEETQATRVALPANAGFSQISFGRGDFKELSLEVRLASQPSSPVQWIVGGYYYDAREFFPGDAYITASDILQASDGSLSLRAGALDDLAVRKQDAVGAFAQATFPITDRLRAIAGIRYSEDNASFYTNGADIAVAVPRSVTGSWNHTDWRAGLQFDVADRSMLYATVATGYRPGGFSPAAPNPAYGIEESTTYEIGSKNELFGRTLRLNLAVYYNDYKGFQQSTFQACFRASPTNPTNTAGLPLCVSPGGPAINLNIVNVGEVEVYGAELNTVWAPTDNDRLTLNVSYIHSEIKSPLLIGLPPAQVQVQGNALPNAPKWAGNASYAHDFELFGGRLTPEVTVRHQGFVNLVLPVSNAFNNQAAVWRFDASLAFVPDNGRWSINAWARNLSNEIVKASQQGAASFLDAPQTYGVSFSVNF
jgi:iron complex outermembrane recepter protein